jgi:hypothetical protein
MTAAAASAHYMGGLSHQSAHNALFLRRFLNRSIFAFSAAHPF